MTNNTLAALRASVTYFAVVFGLAFCLGFIRVVLVVPRVGELLAVFMELPIVLWISWRACHFSIKRHNVSQNVRELSMMGASAFLLLMTAELLLSVIAFGKTANQFFEELVSSEAHLAGLVGQTIYGFFPVMQSRGTKTGKGRQAD